MKQNTKVSYIDGDVWIPEGFKIANDSASTVQEGIVIEDRDENQFVWIPVATIADYERKACEWDDLDSYSETLPSDEQTSVEQYKGFYIGRYETGDKGSTEKKTMRDEGASTTNTITIKANQAPYNYVTRTQAISLAASFATTQGYKAKTKLLSSYAWDTAIKFIQGKVNDYGSSSPQGNYYDVDDFSYTDIEGGSQNRAKYEESLIPTGQTTPVCNIYDMGGNVWEWTTELYPTDTKYPYTYRGGSYSDNFESLPAGSRDIYSDTAYDNIGFRIALFL